MNRKTILGIAVTLLLIGIRHTPLQAAFHSLPPTVLASPETVVAIDPAVVTAEPDQYFTINVTIADVEDLYNWGARISWPTGLLTTHENNVTEGPFLPQGGSTSFTKKVTASYVDVGSMLVGAVPGVDGSGTLATITFKVLESGNCSLSFDTAGLTEGTYTISAVASVVPGELDTADNQYVDGSVIVPSTRLFVNPQSIIDPTLVPGTSFIVDVNVEDVENLYSWQIRLDFNPDVLTYVNVTEGDFLKDQPEGTYSPPPKVEEAWIFFGWSTVGKYPGVGGTGTLATVEFLVLAEGESILDIDDPNDPRTKLFEVLFPPLPPGQEPITEIPCVKENGYFTNLPPQTMDELKTAIEKLGSEDQIDNQGIVKSLLAKLNVAQKLVQSDGPTTAAKNILEAFINEVQAQSGKHMTPEAAHLLIEAAEYIISDL